MSRSQRPAGRTPLQIYLDDHLAGAAAGSRRARRLADAERQGPEAVRLRAVADEIEADRQALLAIADGFGVAPRRYKQIAAGVVERVGLLKLNGRLFGRAALTSLVETELLLVAVRGKLAGWESLAAALGTSAVHDATGGAVDLEGLIARAQHQLEVLAEVHARTAARVLTQARN